MEMKDASAADLHQLKAQLNALVASNAALVGELATISTANDDIAEQVSTLSGANDALRLEADTLVDDNAALSLDVDALVMAAADAAGSALIEDFFTVNAEDFVAGDDSDILVDPFCMPAAGILKFELQLTIE